MAAEIKPLWTEKEQELLNKLRDIRQRKEEDFKPLPPSKYLRREVHNLEGELVPFTFRYYQVQGIVNMVSLTRMVLGDGTGLGKTIQTIGTFCYLLDKSPSMKFVVVAPKSAIRQWKSEIERFTDGIEVYLATVPKGSKKEEAAVEVRQRVYENWANSTKPSVLILNYAILIRDWNHGGYQPLLPNGKPDIKKPVIPGLLDKLMKERGADLTVVFDEATAFKSRRTKTWEVVQFFSSYSKRVYALTATLLKNNLMEGFNIYKAIKPNLFGTQQAFFEQFCYIEYQRVARGQKIPIVVGYKNLDQFKERIELVYLGRPKHLVSKELPTLTTREVTFELDAAEQTKYEEALSGVLELGDGEVREFEETKALTSLIYCQQVVNSLSLLKFKGGEDVREWNDFEGQKVKELSSKEQALLDLLLEELEDEKVIVYTRFASHVPRLMEILKKNKISSVCITGAINDDKRKAAQDEFQNLKSKTRVIFITAAGSEAINLQAAAGMVFFDMPWSWGDYVQCIGRMIRIGSPHKGVLCFHLLAEQAGVGKERKTIDHHVLGLLKRKKTLIDKVLGEAAIGALKFEKDGASVRDLIRSLQKDAARAA
jgi:SNF2 family DNA or RNA helicase